MGFVPIVYEVASAGTCILLFHHLQNHGILMNNLQLEITSVQCLHLLTSKQLRIIIISQSAYIAQ